MEITSSQGKKRDSMKIASLLNKRNPTNSNVQQHKKPQRELTHIKINDKNTFKAESIKSETC